MSQKPRVGLLPLFLKLYDDSLPQMRSGVESFLQQVAEGLAEHGLDVAVAPVCRVEAEFDEAVTQLAGLGPGDEGGADLLVALHLAYSPSLESIGPLCRTSLPLLLLDTTPDYDFGPGVDPGRILYNHGIHGVQDLACMLRRRARPFEIVAGHLTESDVLARAAGIARAAWVASRFAQTRAVRIGERFEGMGDFAVEDAKLTELLGISVTEVGVKALMAWVDLIKGAAVEEELAGDRERFTCRADAACHRRSIRVGLGLRRYLDADGFTALSVNFLAFDSARGPVDTVPFLEIAKAMSRGIGYAGEGDVLTAALVGALLGPFPRTTFTEIFCPDWKGQALFLSHMGEINPAVAAEKPWLCEKPFPYTPANDPAFLACAPAPGPAVLVNLAPGPDDTFRLIVAPVEVLPDESAPAMRETVRGWIRPRRPVAEFLAEYSRCGGTHHSALVLGDCAATIEAFARIAGLECCTIAD